MKRSTMTYKQVQSALKVYKSQGLTSIKLNSKHADLLLEYDRLTMFDDYVDTEETLPESCDLSDRSEYVCDTALSCPLPTPQPRKVNAPSLPVRRNDHIAAAKPNAAPRKQEYDRRKRDANRQPQPKVDTMQQPKVRCVYADKPKSDYFIDTNHSRYTRSLGDTEKQAARNLEQGLRNVISFAKGLGEGLKAKNTTHTLQESDFSAPRKSQPHTSRKVA